MPKYKWTAFSFVIIAIFISIVATILPLSSSLEVPKDSFIITQSKTAPPFSYLNSNGEAKGILIDYWKTWAQENDVTVQFVLTNWSKSLELVKNGDADFHGGAFYSEERDQYFDYANGIFQDKTCVFVRKDVKTRSIRDFYGAQIIPVWVVGGDRTEQYIHERYPRVVTQTVEGSDAVFEKDQLPRAFALDYSISMYYLSKHDLMGEYRVVQTLYPGEYAPMVREGNQELLTFLNGTIKEIGNEEKEKILNQWIRYNLTMSDSLKRNLIIGGVVFFILLLTGNIFFLEKQVKERTATLNQTNKKLEEENRRRKEAESNLTKKLEENQELLEQAIKNEKFKDDFFLNLSHELRTPLNVILGTLQLIELYEKRSQGHRIEDKFKSRLAVIKQNSYRLIKVVNNLIDVSKIDAGHYNMNKQNINIVYLVEEVAQSVAEYIKFKDLELIIDTDTEEIILGCDPIQIERVILNILSNAIKFSPRKGRIWVNMFDKGPEFMIAIKDEGNGIPKDKQKIIFERFRQADDSLSRNHEGSGIGLALVKSLVEMHKGTIRLESKEGVGSEFIITLPVVQVLEEKSGKQKTMVMTENVPIEKTNIEFSDIYFKE